MNGFLLTGIVCLGVISCNRKGAIIFYEKKIINLGSIEFKKAFPGKILIKNAGDEALKISDVNTDCSCTVTDIDNTKILPGDSAYIHFVITPATDGFIQQNIYVDNNSVNESRLLFLIRARVKLVSD